MKKTNFGKVVMAAALLMVGLSAWAVSDSQRAEIEARLQPAGKVCLQGDNACGAAVAAASSGPKSGEEVYTGSCQGCHAVGAGGAPKLGDAADWGTRAGQGMDTLYKHAIEGFSNIGMMPAKGLCMSCSDDEVKAAVDYMVENSK